jgi:hypothetical protein
MDTFKKCEICKKEAKNLCLVCMNYFCDACFEFIYEKEANKQHKKEFIDYFVPFDTKCKQHPTNPISLFCVDDNGKIINLIFNNH